jgi:hypothetical protein
MLKATRSSSNFHEISFSNPIDTDVNFLFRNLFTEMIPLTGTNPAALLIKELVLGGKLSEMEARRMVAFLPYYLRMPSEKLLTSWEDLLKESPSIKTK